MKNLKDYLDPYIAEEEYFPLSEMDYAWASVLAEGIDEIEMNKATFQAFVRFFIRQLPHDWNGKEFMQVKIKIVE